MKKVGVFIFIFAITLSIKAQKTITVNYAKTSHIIFPSEIIFKSSIDEIVATNIPQGAKNIFQIKANKKNFGETNVSVATKDGQFFDYRLIYADKNDNSLINETKRSVHIIDTVYINKNKQIFFIFPEKIGYVDYGDENIKAEQGMNTDNIVTVSAVDIDFEETNVSVATIDGQFYTANILYGTPTKTVFDFSNSKEVLLSDQKQFKNKDEVVKHIFANRRNIFNVGKNEGRVTFTLNNIYSSSDALYLLFQIVNKSSVVYDIKYLKLATEYKKQNKKIASQDQDIEILFKENWQNRINIKDNQSFVIAIPKLTISDKQVLRVYLSEDNGGRNFMLNIPSVIINKAEYIE